MKVSENSTYSEFSVQYNRETNANIFLFFTVSSPALECTQNPLQYAPGVVYMRLLSSQRTGLTTHIHPVARLRMRTTIPTQLHSCLCHVGSVIKGNEYRTARLVFHVSLI
jgi:hypothetical protein